jgi:hypothetical protein
MDRPDYDRWDKLDTFSPWNAAALWIDVEPGPWTIDTEPPTFRDTLAELRRNVPLQDATRMEWDDWSRQMVRVGRPDEFCRRADLLAYAERRGIKPPFLYPEERDRAAPVGWPWGAYSTANLERLAEAAARFWVRYDPADATTAPTNAQVADWLKERGVSGRVADVIATILRADGLPPGPRA